jgi:hypothetical protein
MWAPMAVAGAWQARRLNRQSYLPCHGHRALGLLALLHSCHVAPIASHGGPHVLVEELSTMVVGVGVVIPRRR